MKRERSGYISAGDDRGAPGSVATKKYRRRKGGCGFHQGCFGKSRAEKKSYLPYRFKKDFTVDKRYSR